MSRTLQDSNVSSIIPFFHQPRAFLMIECVCGKRHQVDLNKLPTTTTRQVQVEQECERARHFIIHSGYPRYRKILLISEFGDELCDQYT